MSPEQAPGTYIAFDLGGTQLKAARFGPKGEREEVARLDSSSLRQGRDVLPLLHQAAHSLLGERPLAGIGIGVAGVIDTQEGRIVESPNIPALSGFALREKVRESFGGVAVSMMNDANAAALGEYHAGSGAPYESMFLLTLGTGIGGGFVAAGRIWEGAAGVAGEVGHMCILVDGPECTCGGRGCLEACFSGWALTRDAKALARERPDSALAAQEKLTPHHLARMAEAGDPDAAVLWKRAGKMLGTAIANLMNLLNPACIVLAGGMAQAGDLLLNPARAAWQTQAFERAHRSTPVLLASLGEWAGVRGAVQPLLES